MKWPEAVLAVLWPAAPSLFALPNFPGAEGFGADTKGGRVFAVTNTNASVAGSLAAALLTAGPRIIVFTPGRAGSATAWKITVVK